MIGSDKRDPDGTPPAEAETDSPALPDPDSVDNPQDETWGIPIPIPIPKEHIILFVRDLDRAQQYLDLRDDIRVRRPDVQSATPTQDTASKVALENDRLEKFELLDKRDILAAVHDYFLELEAEQGYAVKAPYDKYPLKEPVGFLLFLARQEGYVLDKSPEAEFDKLRKFAPLYHNDHFIRLQAHVAVKEARTVTVSNLADHVSDEEIMKNFFSTCGVIKRIEMQRESHGLVANVTFKHLSGANQALTYKGRKIPGLSKPTVVDSGANQALTYKGKKIPGLSKPTVVDSGANQALTYKGRKISRLSKPTVVDGETKYEPLLVTPIAVKDARSDREKAEDVERMYAEALERYSAIVGQYPGDESKRGEDCEDLKYWAGCGWMGVEAMANGGYTVGGQRLPYDLPEFADTLASFSFEA